jgi:hypothetical protein
MTPFLTPFKNGIYLPQPITIEAVPGGRDDPDPDYPAPHSDAWVISWSDSRARRRSIVIGPYLYEYSFSFHDGQQEIRRTANDKVWGHPGFGYVVSHDRANTTSSFGKSDSPNDMTRVFAGTTI